MKDRTIAILGLGYVGLPLAVAFAEHFSVIGYDIDAKRIHHLQNGIDTTGELSDAELSCLSRIRFIAEPDTLSQASIYIVTVPTPLHPDKSPDLSYLIQASATIGQYLKPNDLVIYESTVYPGCTEEDCIPLLEQHSGLVLNKDFGVGYSPERINPGDKTRKLKNIRKVVSGSSSDITDHVCALYNTIIEAGLHVAPSIRVAEAAKAVENAQRDVNISFMNELVLMFDKMGIDTGEVLAAASTKWNFLPFRPGLVGGHCIGVDPHYLVHKAKAVGYEPKLIAMGREINEQMGFFLAQKMINGLREKFGPNLTNKKVLILGYAFKENCSDIRNTKIEDTYRMLLSNGLDVVVYDPYVTKKESLAIQFISSIKHLIFDGIIFAVNHDVFSNIDLIGLGRRDAVFVDVRSYWATHR